ncbi:COX assembly mitochondrial protein homolog [Apodemus speciosus]|uniref:COX assembly mitochondrial protein homolog n=1 Tax=Apodemus speciosus TaxID=105296 RepID=A0ABQ0F6A0_APOSI
MALDPAEQHLRHVEKDVLIPKIMREKARERCSEQVEGMEVFYQMLQRLRAPYGIKMSEREFCLERLSNCLHYNDPAFYEECKLEYLKEREEFRKTGVPTKKRLQKLPTNM